MSYFANKNKDNRMLLGNYKSLYIAWSKEKIIRDKGASGGLVSSVLINALDNGLIRGAVVVGMSKREPWRAEVKIAKTKGEVLSAAGSKYVLVPISKILGAVQKEKGKLAVVGLPCHISVIRKLQKAGKYKNVELLVGLFCGYNMGEEATEFLIRRKRVKKEEIAHLEYRGGEYPGGFYIIKKDGKIFSIPKHYYDFLNLMFVPHSCLNCRDFTNELADISVGDTYGYNNCSLAIVRTKKGEKFINKPLVCLKTLDERDAIGMHWHNIKHKKSGDSFFLTVTRIFLKYFGRMFPLAFLGTIAKIRRKITNKWQG